MNYAQATEYLFSQLPMFHRVGAAAYKNNLDNITTIAEVLGNPHRNFRSIHVAGTNGKGSVSHMLASVLQEAGYKTGLFTSPHLIDFRERVKINGQMISEDDVCHFIEAYRKSFDAVKPSFFEWTTALAFNYFSEEQVDVAVIETGLGGRLDSTNIITPELSVITNISFDHKNLLGETLEKIAGEKAGIIKERIPVVIGERQAETANVFSKKAMETGSEIIFAADIFNAKPVGGDNYGQWFSVFRNEKQLFEKMFVGLGGNYQQKNLCTVLQALDMLKEKFPVSDDEISVGLRKVKENTGLMGRWQILGESPLIIADVAHNEAGLSEVMMQVLKTPHENLHLVIGLTGDKDIDSVLALFPKNGTFYFCNADLPRALPAAELQMRASHFGLWGRSYKSVTEALTEARKAAAPGDMIFIGGSAFVVGEVIHIFCAQ